MLLLNLFALVDAAVADVYFTTLFYTPLGLVLLCVSLARAVHSGAGRFNQSGTTTVLALSSKPRSIKLAQRWPVSEQPSRWFLASEEILE